jgi:integrase
MPRKRLTEEGVCKLNPPPEGKQVDYYDAVMPGLVLRMNYGGRKTWRALYYVKGVHKKTGKPRTEPRTHPLGMYPILSLGEAREAARRFLTNPQKALAGGTGSFQEVASEFIKRHVEASKLRTRAEIVRCLNRYVIPHWKDKAFREIKRADVTALLDQIEDDHGARQADMCLAIIRTITHWHEVRIDDYVSPIVKGMSRYVAKDHKRDRILCMNRDGSNNDGSNNDDELRALWTCANGTFGAFVKVLLLTAQRKDKLAHMRWVDVVDGTWRIPTAPREKGNAGTLRLPPLVLDIINKQPRFSPYVFALSGKGAPKSFIKPKRELDQRMREQVPDMAPWVIHDLRRTARSLMSRAGILPHVAEQVLGHVIPGVMGTYDRHGYDLEKADALNRLASLVERITNPPTDNVVPLRG